MGAGSALEASAEATEDEALEASTAWNTPLVRSVWKTATARTTTVPTTTLLGGNLIGVRERALGARSAANRSTTPGEFGRIERRRHRCLDLVVSDFSRQNRNARHGAQAFAANRAPGDGGHGRSQAHGCEGDDDQEGEHDISLSHAKFHRDLDNHIDWIPCRRAGENRHCRTASAARSFMAPESPFRILTLPTDPSRRTTISMSTSPSRPR